MRTLTLSPPEGEWVAVTLEEAETADGPWRAVQAAPVDGLEVEIRFRPRAERGVYRPIWAGPRGQLVGDVVGGHTAPRSGPTAISGLAPAQSRVVIPA